MTIGPIQMIVFSFNRIDRFRGEIMEELANLRQGGQIRVIDVFLAVKEPNGEITATESKDLTEDESIEVGYVIGKLMGRSDLELAEMSPDDIAGDAMEQLLSASSHSKGLDYPGIRQVVEGIEPGKAFGVLLFEHTWAIPLRDAIRRSGGAPLAEGFLTRETLFMLGRELQRIDENRSSL